MDTLTRTHHLDPDEKSILENIVRKRTYNKWVYVPFSEYSYCIEQTIFGTVKVKKKNISESIIKKHTEQYDTNYN